MSGIAIFGITGRMGQTLVRALGERGAAQPLRLVGALASPLSVRLGSDAAAGPAPTGVVITADPRTALKDAVVALDFSLPQCVADNARACMAARVPLLVGATGFDGATREVLKAVAAVIPVLVAQYQRGGEPGRTAGQAGHPGARPRIRRGNQRGASS